jgi:predicted DNA-binding transcriptional regulator YafY
VSGLPGPVAELGLGDTMASAQLKLLATLPRESQADAHRVSSRFHVDLVGWYRRAGPVHFLRELADAVWAERRVTLRYDSWEGIVDRELDPLGLVSKAGDWYLVALPRRAATARTYKVSNIRALTLGGGFTRPKTFDLGAHWSESTRAFERALDRGTATVRVTTRGRRLLRVISAAIEDAVDRTAAGDAIAIPIESIGHATGQLLALGTDVEVVEPAELRERMRDTALSVAAIYGKRGSGFTPEPRAPPESPTSEHRRPRPRAGTAGSRARARP